MKAFFRNPAAVRITLTCLMFALVLSTCVPAGQAQSSLDRHARKIHKKLLKYPQGGYLHLVLRGSSDDYGALGAVSDASFKFTSADNNAVTTYTYSDVARVNMDREPIGEGSERHNIRPRTLIIAGVLVAGAGVAAFAVR